MQVNFEFYGVLQRLAGVERRSLDLPVARTVADVLRELALRMPALAPELERCAVAQGDALIQRLDVLRPELPLALLPPVAGG